MAIYIIRPDFTLTVLFKKLLLDFLDIYYFAALDLNSRHNLLLVCEKEKMSSGFDDINKPSKHCK